MRNKKLAMTWRGAYHSLYMYKHFGLPSQVNSVKVSSLGRANLSYISLQNMANHLNEKHKAGSSACRRVTLSSQKGDPTGQSALYKPFGSPSRVNFVKVKQCGECSTRAVSSRIWGQLFCSHKRSLLKSNSWFGSWESDPSTWERFSSYKQALVIHFVNGEKNRLI